MKFFILKKFDIGLNDYFAVIPWRIDTVNVGEIIYQIFIYQCSNIFNEISLSFKLHERWKTGISQYDQKFM